MNWSGNEERSKNKSLGLNMRVSTQYRDYVVSLHVNVSKLESFKFCHVNVCSPHTAWSRLDNWYQNRSSQFMYQPVQNHICLKSLHFLVSLALRVPLLDVNNWKPACLKIWSLTFLCSFLNKKKSDLCVYFRESSSNSIYSISPVCHSQIGLEILLLNHIVGYLCLPHCI